MKNGNEMKIGLIQYNPKWEDPEYNISIINKMIAQLNEKVDLLIFPEMTLTGFTMNPEKFFEELSGMGTQYFIKLSENLKTNVFAGIIEKNDDGYFNSLVHFDENGLIKARYRKIHPFSFADENKYYKAADELVVTKIDYIKFGLTICYDLRFPELYRLYAKKGIDILVDIANWPVTRIDHWKTLLKARAIENQCFMIGVNRTGSDPTLSYNGFSGIYDPLGNELISITDEEKLIICEIDLRMVEETRKKLPFLDDIKLI
jgi:predicted amidohydrolase